MDRADEIVQYAVVNQDAGMGKGKIAAQVAHAVLAVGLRAVFDEDLVRTSDPDAGTVELARWDRRPSAYCDWLETSFKKIVLKAPGSRLGELEEMGFTAIRDAGHTQVEAGTLTVVALPPMRRADAAPWVGDLKLL